MLIYQSASDYAAASARIVSAIYPQPFSFSGVEERKRGTGEKSSGLMKIMCQQACSRAVITASASDRRERWRAGPLEDGPYVSGCELSDSQYISLR